MTWVLGSVLSLILLEFTGAASSPSQTLNGLPLAEAGGRELYRAACTGCHGVDGKGVPENMTGFDVEIPDFTDCSFSTPETEFDWISIVYNGGPVRAFDRRMPAFGDLLSIEQIIRIVGYVRSLCSDRNWPAGELNLPRPLVTEKAFPENEAVVTSTLTSRAPRQAGNRFLYERRIGSRNQFEIAVPVNFQQRGGPLGWSRGLGDIAIGFKRVLFHSLASGSILSLGGEAALPTGKETEGLGRGHTIVEPFVSFGRILPRDGFLQAQAGAERPITHEAANTETFWRVAIGRSFVQGQWGRTWSPMIEFLGAREMAAGEKAEWDFLPQMQVTLSKRQHIMISAGLRFPITAAQTRDKAFMVYFLWDWFDGGLLSGW